MEHPPAPAATPNEPECTEGEIPDAVHPNVCVLRSPMPVIGHQVDVWRNGTFLSHAHIDSVTADEAVLWVAPTAALPRTLFMRHDGSSIWTSR